MLDEYFEIKNGVLVWKKTKGPRTRVGQRVGSIKEGYLRVKFGGKNYYVHRIVWYLHHGEWPTKMLDHINKDKLDNRIDNLRDVDSRVNQQNTNQFNHGATFCKRDMVWFSRIKSKGEIIHLGSFQTEAEAQEAYKLKLSELKVA